MYSVSAIAAGLCLPRFLRSIVALQGGPVRMPRGRRSEADRRTHGFLQSDSGRPFLLNRSGIWLDKPLCHAQKSRRWRGAVRGPDWFRETGNAGICVDSGRGILHTNGRRSPSVGLFLY